MGVQLYSCVQVNNYIGSNAKVLQQSFIRPKEITLCLYLAAIAKTIYRTPKYHDTEEDRFQGYPKQESLSKQFHIIGSHLSFKSPMKILSFNIPANKISIFFFPKNCPAIPKKL